MTNLVLVLLRIFISTNQHPLVSLRGTTNEAGERQWVAFHETTIATNYVVGFKTGTNEVQLLTVQQAGTNYMLYLP